MNQMVMSSRFWNEKHGLLYVLRLSLIVGLGGFIHGYYLGVLKNFLLYYGTVWSEEFDKAHQIDKDTLWRGLYGLGSSMPLWLVRSSIPDSRRRGLYEPLASAAFHSMFFVLGAFLIVTKFSNLGLDFFCSILGWFIIGCGNGHIFVASTIYLAEISPTRIRGAIVATFFFQIAVGQIVYYLISLATICSGYSSIDDDKNFLGNWHWMLGAIPVLFMFMFVFMFIRSTNWIPEYSPSCLYALGKKEEAIEILRKTSASIKDVASEMKVLQAAVKNIDLDNLKTCMSDSIIENWKVGIACLVAEHLVGMNMVMYYTPRIVVHVLQLEQHSSSSKYLMFATLLIESVLSAIGTLLCIAFVDRYGRRRLLLLSTFGIITCLAFLSFVLYGCSSIGSTNATVDVITASCRITGDGGMGNLGLLALGALGLYFIFHSMGIGTIPWIINTEIYPLMDRIIYGLTTSGTYWFIGAWISFLYGYLDQVISQYNMGIAFLILCLSSCVSCCIVYNLAPETMGYQIEEIYSLLLLQKKMQVIPTSREEIPYMFSSSSSSDDEY